MTVTVRFPLPPQTTESIYLEFDQVTAQQILFKNRALLFLFFYSHFTALQSKTPNTLWVTYHYQISSSHWMVPHKGGRKQEKLKIKLFVN